MHYLYDTSITADEFGTIRTDFVSEIVLPTHRITQSQNHRMAAVGRDLCGSSSPTLPPKQGHLQQAVEDLVQVGLEYFQRISSTTLTTVYYLSNSLCYWYYSSFATIFSHESTR